VIVERVFWTGAWAALLVLGNAGVARAQIGSGWTEFFPEKTVQLRGPGARYTNENGIETFSIQPGDERAETRVHDDHRTGTWQFEGWVNVQPGVTGGSVHQVFKFLMIVAYSGQARVPRGKVGSTFRWRPNACTTASSSARGDSLLKAAKRSPLPSESARVLAVAGGRPPSNTHVSVAGLVASVVEEFMPVATEKQIELRVERVDSSEVACSSGVLLSLLSNLVGNAIKYMALLRSYVRAAAAGGQGFGLGLATVRRLAEGHGGQAGMEPRDPGSLFWFVLPKAQSPS
jgi:hypothetical protein